MSAVIEAKDRIGMPTVTEQAAVVELPGVRQFAADQIGCRLAAEPGLVARFWDQIATLANLVEPDLTVFYCTVQRNGQRFALIEFVAGETLEGFVTRSEPACCEQEIPLFCRVLDAVEGAPREATEKAAHSAEIALLDFGIGRATFAGIAKLHGAVLIGPGEIWSEQIFGADEAAYQSIRLLLTEVCVRLPVEIRHANASGPASKGEFTICSLAPKAQASEPAPKIAEPATETGWLGKSAASPYLIAVGTALLVLLIFYGVGGFLARKTTPPNAGKLILPPLSIPAGEPPIEAPPPEVPQVPVETLVAKVAARAVPVPKKQPAKQPTPTIVLARGARPLRQTKLSYPIEARKERISGVVEMQFIIAEDGSVRSPRVLSGDPLLRAGLAEEISKWVYQPLRVNGKPVPMTTELAIQFSLNP